MLREVPESYEFDAQASIYEFAPKIESDYWIHDSCLSYIPNYGESMKVEELVVSSY